MDESDILLEHATPCDVFINIYPARNGKIVADVHLDEADAATCLKENGITKKFREVLNDERSNRM